MTEPGIPQSREQGMVHFSVPMELTNQKSLHTRILKYPHGGGHKAAYMFQEHLTGDQDRGDDSFHPDRKRQRYVVLAFSKLYNSKTFNHLLPVK